MKLSSNKTLFEDKMSTHKDTEILYRHFALNHNLAEDFSFQIFAINVLHYRINFEIWFPFYKKNSIQIIKNIFLGFFFINFS